MRVFVCVCVNAAAATQFSVNSVLFKNKYIKIQTIYYNLRKAIEGYLDSVPSLTFYTIKTKLIMHAFHS